MARQKIFQRMPPPESPEPTSPPPNAARKLRQFIRNARADAKRGGDVNVAQVGEGAQIDQIAVGRNILQAKINIGTFVLPVRFLLALLGVALLVAVGAWFYFVPATMPPNTTNVAVANFGQTGADGRAENSARAEELSAYLFGKLRTAQPSLPDGTTLTVWNDRMSFLEKRAPLGRIDTEAQAIDLANRIGADMVIFGNLDAGQDPAQFVPQFYVRQEKREADELTGAQQLGKKLNIDKSVGELKDYLDQNLQPRAQAVLWFARGIGLDALGEYAKSYQVFCRADVALTDWDADQGREILYYFLGREALFAARTDEIARATQNLPRAEWGNCAPFNSAAEATDAAQKWFEKSITTNSQYARAYYGVGQAHAQRANAILRVRDQPPAALETARVELASALENYKAALERLPQGDTRSLVDLKTRAAIGSAHILLGQTFALSNQTNAAIQEYAEAEAALEGLARAIPSDQTRFLAQTFYTLGVARRLRAHQFDILLDPAMAKVAYTAAVNDFAQCLTIGKREPNDEFLRDDLLVKCADVKMQVEQALASLP